MTIALAHGVPRLILRDNGAVTLFSAGTAAAAATVSGPLGLHLK